MGQMRLGAYRAALLRTRTEFLREPPGVALLGNASSGGKESAFERGADACRLVCSRDRPAPLD